MPIKVLYVLGTGSRNNNQELRWSLRSLERHAVCEVEPVICGWVPDWFKGDALAVSDIGPRKEKNIMNKIMAAIRARLVTGEFQISADDHFWNKDVDLAYLPRYFRRGILPEFRTNGNNYDRALAGTRDVLLANGYPAMDTTVHCNQWVRAADLPVVEGLVKSADGVPFASEYGIASWAVWPNVGITSDFDSLKARRPVVWKKDVKLGDVSSAEMEAIVRNELIFSCNDDAFLSRAFVGHMENEFGGKSRWEK